MIVRTVDLRGLVFTWTRMSLRQEVDLVEVWKTQWKEYCPGMKVEMTSLRFSLLKDYDYSTDSKEARMVYDVSYALTGPMVIDTTALQKYWYDMSRRLRVSYYDGLIKASSDSLFEFDPRDKDKSKEVFSAYFRNFPLGMPDDVEVGQDKWMLRPPVREPKMGEGIPILVTEYEYLGNLTDDEVTALRNRGRS